MNHLCSNSDIPFTPIRERANASPVPSSHKSFLLRGLQGGYSFLCEKTSKGVSGILLFPQRLQALELGPETLAMMGGAFGLGMFLFSTPTGALAGRIGRKPILFISLAGFSVMSSPLL
jgi:MFS family permease